MQKSRTLRRGGAMCTLQVFATLVACSAASTKLPGDASGAGAGEAGFHVGGTVGGLLPETTVQLVNGPDTLQVGNATFVFPTRVATGATYHVTVGAQPVGQSCVVSNGQGAVSTGTVTSVGVTCTPTQLSVGGQVSGLPAMSAVSLTVNGVAFAVAANGAFIAPSTFVSGNHYTLNTWANPPGVSCAVTQGSGTVVDSNVTTVSVACAAAAAPSLHFTTGQQAVSEIGQPTFNTASTTLLRSASTLTFPRFGGRYSYKPFAMSGGALYVPDFWNFRVLVFNAVPSTNFVNADSVMGLYDPNNVPMTHDFLGQGTLWVPMGVFGGPGFLVVSNQTVFNSIFTYPTGFPTVDPSKYVITGIIDTDCTQQGVGSNGSADVRIYNDMLLATDNTHNRILVWSPQPKDPTQRTPPTAVLGQPNFTSCDSSTTSATFNSPMSLYADDAHFIVADTGNNRVLIWNRAVSQIAAGDAADVVLGQADFGSSAAGSASAAQFTPMSVDSDGQLLVVADQANNRVLVWNSLPTRNNQPADAVLGQTDAVSNLCNQSSVSSAFPNAGSLCAPYAAVVAAPFLIVNDGGNGRVMIFKSQSSTQAVVP